MNNNNNDTAPSADSVAPATSAIDYETLLAQLRSRTVNHTGPLFYTAAPADPSSPSLYDLLLDNLPPHERQQYRCNACRKFVNTYGGIVLVHPETGEVEPLFWRADDAPVFFRAAVTALARAVRRSPIVGVVFSPASPSRAWGVASNEDKVGRIWRHMSCAASGQTARLPLTCHEATALSLEEHGMLRRSLATFTAASAQEVVRLFESGQLYRSEKHLACARWFADLHAATARVPGTRAVNLIWHAAATAPIGWCHVRSGLLGTLLEDVQLGKSFEQIRRAHAAKMDPLQYQRPSAAPTAGAIAAAEKLVESLGISRSLDRRFARIEECKLLWVPTVDAGPAPSPTTGRFGHLVPKGTAQRTGDARLLPATTMTWVKFRQQVLPTAQKTALWAGDYRWPLGALTTALHGDAPPILQWDQAGTRNPVSWYLYATGSFPSEWSLPAEAWVPVTGITLLPYCWSDEAAFAHHARGVFLLLEGAQDRRKLAEHATGNCLFPEQLKAELHDVRRVIEEFSRTARMHMPEQATACGLKLTAPSFNPPVLVQVTGPSGVLQYKLDRWD